MKIILIASCLLGSVHFSFGQNIVQAEYFVDTDLGFGNNTLVNVTSSPDGIFPFTVNLSNLAVGYHKLYIRTRDSLGKWSITSRRNIEVVPNSSFVIKNGEYFFDIDPGYDAGNPITISSQDSSILQNFNAVVAGLPAGYHKLYIRLKDVNGNWGQTGRRNMELVTSLASASVVKGAEYFFNTDPGAGNANAVTFITTLPDGTFSFKIPLENIPTGANTLYIRVKDSVNQNLSLTQWQADSVITSVQSGLWSDINTWSNRKIPDRNTVVILHHDVIVDIDAFCKSLTPYRNDVDVTVNQGKILLITGH
ncbi:MAG: hypothetical protein ABI760_08070 [Ferruginibacter sp.]